MSGAAHTDNHITACFSLQYHYAVGEVLLDAYCPCNGHGISCKYNDTVKDNQCVCQPGTCGDACDKCCHPFNQFPWKPGSKGPMVVDEAAACQRKFTDYI